jgi:phospholipid/cholesterol/gamma-HCH transport system substrate-binding protein
MDHSVRVGMVILLAVILLVLGVFWGERENIFKDYQIIQVQFEDVSGLNPGDPVTIRGVAVGKVKSIYLEKSAVRVNLQIPEGIPVYTDAVVLLEPMELLGRKRISIFPGTDTKSLVTKVTVLNGVQQPSVERIASAATRFMAEAENFLKEFDSFLAEDMNEMAQLTRELRNFFRKNRVPIELMILNLSSITNDWVEYWNKYPGQWQQYMDKVKILTYRMDTLSVQLTTVFNQLSNESTTVGKLLSSDSLYRKLEVTLQSMDSLMADIRSNPEKYLKEMDVNLKIFDGR